MKLTFNNDAVMTVTENSPINPDGPVRITAVYSLVFTCPVCGLEHKHKQDK